MRKIKYPLIVSDFDGTLVRADGTVSDKNKAAIKEYIAAGGVFAISTGRLPAAILSRVRELGLTGLVCCSQGAIIVDIETQKILLEGRLAYESALAACRKMEEMNLHIHAYDVWDYFVNIVDEPLRYYEAITQTKAVPVVGQPLSSFLEERKLAPCKLLAMVEREKIAQVFKILEAENIPQTTVTKSAEVLLEINPTQYSKGTAVAYLAERYKIPVEKTVAVGDQLNDLSMLQTAGIGIAVKNADDMLKERVDCVFDYTNEEDAVARVIEKYGFHEEK